MSDNFGYNQQFTDKPGMWDVDGYCTANSAAVSSDGYLVVQTVSLSTQGTLVNVAGVGPSAVIRDITRTGTGAYQLNLRSTFVQCTWANFGVVIGSGTKLVALETASTVGQAGFGPGFANPQSISFLVTTLTGTPTDVGDAQQLVFRLRLKQSSA